MESHDEEPVELDALKKRLQVAVQFDTKILDADSRVRRMLHSLMKTLAVDGQDWVLHQEGKLVVGIITKVIQPAPLQLAVTKQLQLQRNKVLKSDVFRYIKWLRQFTIGYQLYSGMDKEKPSKPPADEPRKENSRPLDGMLVNALKQRGVWDMAKAGDADQTSANVKRLQEAYREDPEDALYAEDVACSTPAMEKPADQDGEIKRILDGKIAEAIQLGLS
ncbi:hypothetical protein DYB31_010929, partial [Aphanomyces astaci]